MISVISVNSTEFYNLLKFTEYSVIFTAFINLDTYFV